MKGLEYHYSMPCKLQKFIEEGLSCNKMGLPLCLTHTTRGQWDDDGIGLKERENGDAAQFHVKLLFVLWVNLTLGLVYLKEVLNYWLIDIMAHRVLYLLYIQIEFPRAPLLSMIVFLEEPVYQFWGFAFLKDEWHHLIYQIGYNIPILILPLCPKPQLYLAPLPSFLRWGCSSRVRLYRLRFKSLIWGSDIFGNFWHKCLNAVLIWTWINNFFWLGEVYFVSVNWIKRHVCRGEDGNGVGEREVLR